MTIFIKFIITNIVKLYLLFFNDLLVFGFHNHIFSYCRENSNLYYLLWKKKVYCFGVADKIMFWLIKKCMLDFNVCTGKWKTHYGTWKELHQRPTRKTITKAESVFHFSCQSFVEASSNWLKTLYFCFFSFVAWLTACEAPPWATFIITCPRP